MHIRLKIVKMQNLCVILIEFYLCYYSPWVPYNCFTRGNPGKWFIMKIHKSVKVLCLLLFYLCCLDFWSFSPLCCISGTECKWIIQLFYVIEGRHIQIIGEYLSSTGVTSQFLNLVMFLMILLTHKFWTL